MSRHIYRVVGADGSFWGWFHKRKHAEGQAYWCAAPDPPEWMAEELRAARPVRVQRTKAKWEDVK